MILSEKMVSNVCEKLNKISIQRKWGINGRKVFISNHKKYSCIRIEEESLIYLKKNTNADKQQILKWLKEIILNEYSEITKFRLTLYISTKFIMDYDKEDFINQPHIDLF